MTRTQLNLFETTYDIIDQKVNDSFWAYHAGMADGDGCFIGKNKIFYSLGLIDKRKKVRDICKKYGVQIEDVEPISLQRRLDWLCGYFDAEGNVQMRTVRNKKSNTHVFSFKLRFTSCSLLTLRYVKRILNLLFNRNGEKSILGLYKKPDKRQNRKQCYDLEIRKVSKIHLFARVFHPHIKVQRKIDKFKRICSYSNIAAQLKWTFGSINFKKNKKLRERWLKNDT
jgi:hypothetical protein